VRAGYNGLCIRSSRWTSVGREDLLDIRHGAGLEKRG
jgi:hypothetical protein